MATNIPRDAATRNPEASPLFVLMRTGRASLRDRHRLCFVLNRNIWVERGGVVIYAVTVNVDIQSIDGSIGARLMGRPDLVPGMTRRIPRGIIVFSSAYLNNEPGQPSLFRFSLQFGSVHGAAAAGNWLFAQLHGTAAALSLAGHPVPIDHGTIISVLRQVA